MVALAVVVLAVVLNLVQQPGLITFDTKLDLQFDVADFLARSLSVWNGDSAVGGLQNQASGYLFPMGPAFWLGDVLHVPMWVWERLWSAAVMLLAYAGVRRLAAQLAGHRAAGARARRPHLHARASRPHHRRRPQRRDAARPRSCRGPCCRCVLYLRGRLLGACRVPVVGGHRAWMGGQNATLVVACLVLPGLLLLSPRAAPGDVAPRRAPRGAPWSSSASLWWLVPLLLMGGYAPPFLDFIESSYNTASDTSWLSSVRGTSHWVAFFPDGGSAGWVGGYELASSSDPPGHDRCWWPAPVCSGWRTPASGSAGCS